MPLIETVLENQIKSHLEIEFKKPATKQALTKQLDGGSLNGLLTSAKNMAGALGNIKDKTTPIMNNTPDIIGASSASEELITRITSNEFANAISDSVCEWLASTIAPIMAKTIANDVTTYIKTATIIIPPGQVVATPAGPGATSTPSPPAQIS
jgi:hypothetical protein